MRYSESLILGLLTGCTALIVQVFISILGDISSVTLLPQNYDPQNLHATLCAMLLIATIEETLRFIIAIKKFSIPVEGVTPTQSFLLHGFFLGSGFALCEILLAIAKLQHITISLFLFIWPFLIHIIVSIFAVYIARNYRKKMIFFCVLLCAIIFHACANFAILITFN
ncbi:MAG: hypothetical protein WC819_06630 [Parcubacteria group bacterium]|jgi:hypothetical protein